MASPSLLLLLLALCAAPPTASDPGPGPGPPQAQAQGQGQGQGQGPPPAAAAKPGGDGDAIQALIDAAQAVTDDQVTGRTVRLPQRPTPYRVTAPVYLDGLNVTLAGEGPGTWVDAGENYGGPPLAVGVVRLERQGIDPARFRPASALRPDRRGFDTMGEACLAVTAHPAQLGAGSAGSIVPDYYQGPVYTWEFMVGKSASGADWLPGSGLVGMQSAQRPQPWAWMTGPPGTLEFDFRTAEQDEATFRKATFPVAGPGPWRVTTVFDGDAGRVVAWVDGRRQPVTLFSFDGTPLAPGSRLDRQDGDAPFVVGSTFGGVAQGDGSVTPMALHGLNISRGRKYVLDAPTETRADGQPVWDARFTETQQGPAVQTVAFLPMDDPPATHVRLNGATSAGVGFIVPGRRLGLVTSGIAVRDLKLTTRLQQALAVGQVFDLALSGVRAGGDSLQGVGSVPIGCTYFVTFDDSQAGGLDCAYYGFQQIVSSRNLKVTLAGRDGVRFAGGDGDWELTRFTFALATTDTYFRFVSNGYGGTQRVGRCVIDNEAGGPRVAVVLNDHSPYCTNRLTVDGLSVAAVGSPALIALRGRRTPATGGMYPPARLDARNLNNNSGGCTCAVKVDGPGWYGDLDARGFDTGSVAGDAQRVNVTPPAPVD